MEFVFPQTKDDLCKRVEGCFYVKERYDRRQLIKVFDDNRQALQNKKSAFILEHFDDFFSILLELKNLEDSMIGRAFDRLCKSTEVFVKELETQDFDEDRKETLCKVKMHAYLLSNLMNFLEEHTLQTSSQLTVGRKKKTEQKSDARKDWEFKRNKILLTIHNWLLLPLNRLWDPPIAEQSFVMLIADICYKIIENDKDKSDKQIKQVVWQILGTLVRNYSHGLSCKIKIIQLVKMYDILAPIIAQGVVSMITEHRGQSFIAEILHEIEQVNFEESEARNIASFLSTIAITNPQLFVPEAGDIMEHIFGFLDNESYVMRICALEIIECLVINCLSGENLNKKQKELRDECFQYLNTHKLDVNAFVRSKVFQIWQKLLASQTVPVQQIIPILKATIPHLLETSATMRKQALQTLRHLLECNPFTFKFNKEQLVADREDYFKKLRDFQAHFVAESACGDNERIELLKQLTPDIKKAIKRSLEDDENEDNDLSDEDQEEEDIDIDKEWESIRTLIIDRKCLSAVKKLKAILKKIELASDAAGIEAEDREDCYFLFLAHIFLGSQSDDINNDKFDSAEWKKRKDTVHRMKQSLNIYNTMIDYVTEFEETMPTVRQMLNAAAPGVAIEACTLLGRAYKFNIPGAEAAFHAALLQAFCREESVRKNVAEVYKDIYFKSEENVPSRHRAMTAVNGLINLLKTLKPGQSPALEQLVNEWCDNEDLDEESWQIMWEKYSFKSPSVTVIESRCAIILLKMVAAKNPKIIRKNLNICIKIGFQTHDDILLARDTCKALSMMRHENTDDCRKEPLKFENEHELFGAISSLLIDKFETTSPMPYASLATEAINVIYQFANTPDMIIKDILSEISAEPAIENDVPESHLAKFLYVIGHVAVRHMVHLDVEIYKELKRRNAIRDALKGKKKNPLDNTRINESTSSPVSVLSSARKARQSMNVTRKSSTVSEDPEEEILAGATADDDDAETINDALDNVVVDGSGLLAKYVPLVEEVCQYPEKYSNKYTQVWGVLALTKMMTVSSQFCQNHLQLLMTILERSPYPEIRSNILIGLSDLMIRFTNDIDPWCSHMYSRLQDKDVGVRRTAVKILSSLVKREMIRAKGQLSEMALCIVDDDEQIKNDAQLLFRELSKKPNLLCNMLPDILSKFSSEFAEDKVTEDESQIIFKFILSLFSKEREMESVLDKICFRFKDVTTERQSRILTDCLALLQLNKKGITHLTRNLPLFKDQLQNKHVYLALKEVIDQAKKKADVREACAILEQEIEKLMDDSNDNHSNSQRPDKENENPNENQINNTINNDDDDREAMPPPDVSPPRRRSKRQSTKRRKN